MRTNFLLSAIVASAAVFPAVGTEPCSIHPPKRMFAAQLAGLAKLTQAQAEKIAVAQLNTTNVVSTASAELEAEHGCLIWSFDLHVTGQSGVQEVQVDAGSGKVLSVKHESVRQEATEKSNGAAVTPQK